MFRQVVTHSEEVYRQAESRKDIVVPKGSFSRPNIWGGFVLGSLN